MALDDIHCWLQQMKPHVIVDNPLSLCSRVLAIYLGLYNVSQNNEHRNKTTVF